MLNQISLHGVHEFGRAKSPKQFRRVFIGFQSVSQTFSWEGVSKGFQNVVMAFKGVPHYQT